MAGEIARWYPNGLKNFMEGDVDWDADTIKVALGVTHTYLDTDEFFSDVNTEEITGTGYTAGGETLGTKTNVIVDSSALTAWAATTAHEEGDLVRAVADNGHVFRCVVAGTTGASEPTWILATMRETADASVVWVEFGAAIQRLLAATAQWTGATFTAEDAWVYKDTGTPTTSPLLGHVDFGGSRAPSAGTFDLDWDDNNGILRVGAGSPTVNP